MLMNFLFCVAALWANPTAHPVYLSVTEIHYKPEKQRIEIGMKVFSDDLSDALSRQEGRTIEIGTERESKDATDLITNYTRKHFSLYANGQKLNCKYVGREIERSDFFAMWTYWEIDNVPKLQTLEVENNILISLFATQNNIITLREGSSVRRASLVKHQTKTSFSF